VPIASLFLNRTRRTSVGDISGLIATANSNDELEVPPIVPTGVPIWRSGGVFTANNVSLTCAAGKLNGGIRFAGAAGNVGVNGTFGQRLAVSNYSAQ